MLFDFLLIVNVGIGIFGICLMAFIAAYFGTVMFAFTPLLDNAEIVLFVARNTFLCFFGKIFWGFFCCGCANAIRGHKKDYGE